MDTTHPLHLTPEQAAEFTRARQAVTRTGPPLTGSRLPVPITSVWTGPGGAVPR